MTCLILVFGGSSESETHSLEKVYLDLKPNNNRMIKATRKGEKDRFKAFAKLDHEKVERYEVASEHSR